MLLRAKYNADCTPFYYQTNVTIQTRGGNMTGWHPQKQPKNVSWTTCKPEWIRIATGFLGVNFKTKEKSVLVRGNVRATQCNWRAYPTHNARYSHNTHPRIHAHQLLHLWRTCLWHGHCLKEVKKIFSLTIKKTLHTKFAESIRLPIFLP